MGDSTLCLLDRVLIADVRRWWEQQGQPAGIDRAELLDLLSLAMLEADALWTLLPRIASGAATEARIYVRPTGRVELRLLLVRGENLIVNRHALVAIDLRLGLISDQ